MDNLHSLKLQSKDLNGQEKYHEAKLDGMGISAEQAWKCCRRDCARSSHGKELQHLHRYGSKGSRHSTHSAGKTEVRDLAFYLLYKHFSNQVFPSSIKILENLRRAQMLKRNASTGGDKTKGSKWQPNPRGSLRSCSPFPAPGLSRGQQPRGARQREPLTRGHVPVRHPQNGATRSRRLPCWGTRNNPLI